MEWIWLVALLILAIISYLVYKRLMANKSGSAFASNDTGQGYTSPPSADISVADYLSGDLTKMKVGGFIRLGTLNHTIKGIVHFTEDSYQWWEYYLDDGSWLSVEVVGGQTDVAMWEKVVPSELEPDQKKSLIHNDVTYLFEERGTARYTTTGTTDLKAQGTVEYFDYATSDGGYFLSIEFYDGVKDGEVSIGEAYDASMVEYYPPS